MKISSPVLLDSNVLIYAHNQSSLLHNQALALIQSVIEGDIKGVLAQQNLLEFYSIITDQKRVTNPLSLKDAFGLVTLYLDSPFKVIYPTDETAAIAFTLGCNLKFKDGKIFDAYLVATMFSNNINTIITANIKDFNKFPGIQIIDLDTFKG